ncbi:MAG: hypothetical protein GWP19_13395 [Planctomycetia bacterium]|nr:hypothetical protein [Planctomycetia bacterium]
MNTKKFLLASLAVFITLQILDFVIHNLLLGSVYESIQEVFRPDMMDKMWIMYLTGAIFSLLFVYIFSKGYEGKGLIEGAKYGLIIGLFFSLVGSYNQYVVYPLPYSLVLKWFIYGTIELIIAGVVLALVYKPKEQ